MVAKQYTDSLKAIFRMQAEEPSNIATCACRHARRRDSRLAPSMHGGIAVCNSRSGVTEVKESMHVEADARALLADTARLAYGLMVG